MTLLNVDVAETTAFLARLRERREEPDHDPAALLRETITVLTNFMKLPPVTTLEELKAVDVVKIISAKRLKGSSHCHTKSLACW